MFPISASSLWPATVTAFPFSGSSFSSIGVSVVNTNIQPASGSMTFVAAVREIDAASLNQFVYTIAREDYVYIVPDEVPVYNDILYVIPNENWTYNITAETRVFPVDEETRIYNIRST